MRSEGRHGLTGRAMTVALALALTGRADAQPSPEAQALPAQLHGRLVVAGEAGLAPLPWTQPPRLLLLYVGAGWCGPCHALTPVLRDLRATLRHAGADTEVVMVSLDATPASLLRELRQQALPWPAVDPRQAPRLRAVQRLAGPAPPQLVLIEDGRILAQAWQGRRYPGPRPVLQRWIEAACAQAGSHCGAAAQRAIDAPAPGR